jgi:hypothetical protein
MAVLFLQEGLNQLGAIAGVGQEERFPQATLNGRFGF